MIKLILQFIANNILVLMSKSTNEKELIQLHSFGLYLDDFTIRYFNIYLD